MPWYDYECRDCKEIFSLQREVADRDSPAVCPKCASTRSRRRLSSFMTTATSSSGNGSPGCSGFT